MDMTQIFKYPLVFIPSPVRWENFPNALTALPFFKYIGNSFTIVLSCVGKPRFRRNAGVDEPDLKMACQFSQGSI